MPEDDDADSDQQRALGEIAQHCKSPNSSNKVQADHHEVDRLDSDEGNDHAAEAPDQQVAAQQRVRPKGPILNAFEGDRDQERNDQCRPL